MDTKRGQALSSVVPSQLSQAEFVELFGSVYEHSAWVAEQTYKTELDEQADTLEGLSAAFANVFLNADADKQRQVILAHPDLAGKAALKGELTQDSASEQSGAGIDQCSPEELARFEDYNKRYKERFEFPFIMAVKGSNRYAILEAFEIRLQNDAQTEFQTALHEINKIAQFRLQSILDV